MKTVSYQIFYMYHVQRTEKRRIHMKKRILSILLAALMLCVLVPQLAGIAVKDGQKLFDDMLENQREYLPKGWFK